jgi:hypothetical protein
VNEKGRKRGNSFNIAAGRDGSSDRLIKFYSSNRNERGFSVYRVKIETIEKITK